MRNYLSFGGGVNSVALHLHLLDQGVDFESVFVNHGTDWPETYQYLAGFQWWLKANGHRPITILSPTVAGHSNLYEYCHSNMWVPSHMRRWCTDKFKIRPLNAYFKTPAFVMLGIDASESHRARIAVEKGIEKRYPLIEAEIDRAGCKRIILDHGLPIPMKSGCFICPYQSKGQWIELRTKHSDLFCKARQLEERNRIERAKRGKAPLTLSASRKTLDVIVNEGQAKIFEADEYPPCHCGL